MFRHVGTCARHPEIFLIDPALRVLRHAAHQLLDRGRAAFVDLFTAQHDQRRGWLTAANVGPRNDDRFFLDCRLLKSRCGALGRTWPEDDERLANAAHVETASREQDSHGPFRGKWPRHGRSLASSNQRARRDDVTASARRHLTQRDREILRWKRKLNLVRKLRLHRRGVDQSGDGTGREKRPNETMMHPSPFADALLARVVRGV